MIDFRFLASIFIFCLVTLCWAAPCSAESISLAEPLRYASDVRWLTDSSVAVAAGREGAFEVSVADGSIIRQLVAGLHQAFPLSTGISRAPVAPALFHNYQIAISGELLAFAGYDGSVAWLEGDRRSPITSFRSLHDLDVRAGRLLILGVPDFESTNGYLWSLRIGGEEQPEVLAFERPVDPARREEMFRGAPADWPIPKAAKFAICGGPMGGIPGSVRFMADGSFLVVPGAERGVYLYTPRGRLAASWPDLGFVTGCDAISDMEASTALRSDPTSLAGFWAGFRILDEVMADGSTPILIVRSVTDGTVRWQHLRLDGASAASGTASWSWDSPLVSTSLYAHLRGDVRGDRAVYLISDYGPDDEANRPNEQLPRLEFENLTRPELRHKETAR